MRLDKVRTRPFLLLMLQDGVRDGHFTLDHIKKIEKQLIDMSLNIGKNYFSPVIRRDLQKSCEIVLGITTLGLLRLSEGDSSKARSILTDDSVVNCFRRGWRDVSCVLNMPHQIDTSVLLGKYQCSANEHSDIVSVHDTLFKELEKQNILKEIGREFDDQNLDIDMEDNSEEKIRGDIQLYIFNELIKSNGFSKIELSNIRDLLKKYRDDVTVFHTEIDIVLSHILDKKEGGARGVIEEWIPEMKAAFTQIFPELNFRKDDAFVNFDFFEKLMEGLMPDAHRMYLYESLSKKDRDEVEHKTLFESDPTDMGILDDELSESDMDMGMEFGLDFSKDTLPDY